MCDRNRRYKTCLVISRTWQKHIQLLHVHVLKRINEVSNTQSENLIELKCFNI